MPKREQKPWIRFRQPPSGKEKGTLIHGLEGKTLR